jgi:predicted GIY-YIG superfamily endonuclease
MSDIARFFGSPSSLESVAETMRGLRSKISIAVLESWATTPNVTPDIVIDNVLAAVAQDLKVARLHVLGAVERATRSDLTLSKHIERADRRIAHHIDNCHRAELVENVGFDPHGFFVYVLWDHNGSPLYVGQSTNVLSRLGTHMAGTKRRSTARVTLTKHRTRSHMDKAEMALIREYRPRLNIVGMPTDESSGLPLSESWTADKLMEVRL